MNALSRTATISGAALISLIIFLDFPVYAGTENTGNISFLSAQDPLTPNQEAASAQETKRIALSAAAKLIEKTRLWKRVAVMRKRIAERYSFTFRKNFSDTGSRKEAQASSADGKEKKPGEMVFSGGINQNLTPTLSFSSGFRPANIALTLDVLDQDLYCEISSRPVNRLIGGKTSLGLSSDLEKSQAILKISFEF